MHDARGPVIWMVLAAGCGTAPARLDAGPATAPSAAPVVDVSATPPAEVTSTAPPTASAAATAAQITTLDGSCHEQPGGPLKAGKYELRVGTPAVTSDKASDFRLVKAMLTVAP
jgi:hypothetical protein